MWEQLKAEGKRVTEVQSVSFVCFQPCMPVCVHSVDNRTSFASVHEGWKADWSEMAGIV